MVTSYCDQRRYYRSYCPNCGHDMGTATSCCTSYDTTGYYNTYTNSGRYLVKRILEIPWKQRLWAWLHKQFPSVFKENHNTKTYSGIKKKYFQNRAMFCKSGYLPKRIRNIRK